MSKHAALMPAGKMMYREFWEAGIPVFPLWRINKRGECECGHCEAPGKHPNPTGWQHTPIWDEEQITNAELAGSYDTGYGVLCRGLLIVDIDERNGGIASYERMLETIPEVAGAGLFVYTGSGGGSRHLYFKAPADVSFVTNHPDYPGIDFKSSGYVVGPGSAHKSGGIYTAHGSVDDIDDLPQSLVALLKRPDVFRSEYDGLPFDASLSDLADMLKHIAMPPTYAEWLKVGMAVHHASQGTGLQLWVEWSKGSEHFDDAECARKWGSFGKGRTLATVGTLILFAQQGGWVRSVTFEPDAETIALLSEPKQGEDGLPFDISGVDLTAPPGFVGDVARWLSSQSQFPRKHLAVGGALFAVGNIGGLRYIDDVSDVTANLLVFCIAESGTGKEGILQGAASLMRIAGMSKACYGRIKSDKEFLANSIRHQAIVYILDEFGEFLKKVETARTKGTASYLEGVYGRIMEIFSKAGPGKVLQLGGDDRDDLYKQLGDQLSKAMTQSDASPTPYLESRIRSLEGLLAMLDTGIERPFLSLLGVTTPNLFEDLMTPEMARSGFIGRAMMFNERINVPDGVFGHIAPPIPEDMANMLRAIWSGGEYDMLESARVENYDVPSVIPSTPQARQMLSELYPWRLTKARAEEEATGLHTLWNRFYEGVAKVSLILAIPEQLRTEEHVRWAVAMVKRDIEEKIRLVGSNRTGSHEKTDAMGQRILSILGDETMTDSVIFNRLRTKYRKEEVIKALATLAELGVLVCAEKAHPTNKTTIRRYAKAAR